MIVFFTLPDYPEIDSAERIEVVYGTGMRQALIFKK